MASSEAQFSLFWNAVSTGDVLTVSSLIKQGSYGSGRTDTGWTVVHEAAANGLIDMTNLLIHQPEFSDFMFDYAGTAEKTPFIIAIEDGNLELLKVLWEHAVNTGKKMKALDVTHDKYNWCILGWAVYCGSLPIVDYLLSLKDPLMGLDCDKPLILNATLTRPDLGFIRQLIDRGVDVNRGTDKQQPPLIGAARRGLLDVIKVLVEYGKADIYIRDHRGNLPVDIAEKSGQHECAAYLRGIMIKQGHLEEATRPADDFTLRMKWFRPRTLGPIVSARSSPTSVLVNDKLYFGGGVSLPSDIPHRFPDANGDTLRQAEGSWFTDQNPFEVYVTPLPAKDMSMLPKDSLPMHEIMTEYYAGCSSLTPRSAAGESKDTSDTASDEPSSVNTTATSKSQTPSIQQPIASKNCDNIDEAQGWATKYSSPAIRISADQFEASYVPDKVTNPAVVVALKYMQDIAPASIAYYEVTIADLGQYGYIGVGYASPPFELDQHLGWRLGAYGLHGDIGCVFHASSFGGAYSPRFQTGDVIGCGIDFSRRELFYTRNGQYLGPSHQGVDTTKLWLPAVSMQSPGERVVANFGKEPFWFDFVAATLQTAQLPICPTLDSFFHPILVPVPSSLTPTNIGALFLSAKALCVLREMPEAVPQIGGVPTHAGSIRAIPGFLHDLDDMPKDILTAEELRMLTQLAYQGIDQFGYFEQFAAHYSNPFPVKQHYWKPIPLSLDPQIPHQSAVVWRAIDGLFASDVSTFSTDTHLFLVSPPNKVSGVSSHILWSIEWSTGVIQFMPLKKVPLADEGTHHMDVSFDENILAVYSFTTPRQCFVLPTQQLVQLITSKDYIIEPVPEWETVFTTGTSPLSSRLNFNQLQPGLFLSFGGYEELAAQNSAYFMKYDMTSKTNKLTFGKARMEGTAPRSRFYASQLSTHHGLLTNSPSTPSDMDVDPPALSLNTVLATSKPKETSPSPSPRGSPSTTLAGDEHDHTLYIWAGWNGWTAVPDVDIAHIYLPKRLTLAESISLTFDVTLKFADNSTLQASKILLYCRSSFFRKLYSFPGQNNASLALIDMGSLLSNKDFNASHMKSLFEYFIYDAIACPTGSPSTLLALAELLCPEHVSRLHDQFFSTRIIHEGTLHADFMRSLDASCPIKPDLEFVSKVDEKAGPFQGHMVLALKQSPFFHALLSGDYSENKMVNGIRRVTLQADPSLLAFLWPAICTGTVDLNAIGDCFIDFFELAHQLQLTSVVDFITPILISNIDADNVDILEAVAQDHHIQKLAAACAKFRSAHLH